MRHLRWFFSSSVLRLTVLLGVFLGLAAYALAVQYYPAVKGIFQELQIVGKDDAASLATFMPGTDTAAVGVPDMKVGIGTATPTTALEVVGTVKATTFIGSGSGLTNLPTSAITDGAITSTKIASATIADANIASTAAIAGTKVASNFGTQNVLTTGSAGIGTAAPAAKLHVVGADSLNTSAALNASGATGTGLVVTNAGNVGIGTTAPAKQLDVWRAAASAGEQNIRAADPSQGIALLVMGGVNALPAVQSLGTSKSLEFLAGNNNDAHYLFTSSGNVSIGTTSPSGRVTVQTTGGAMAWMAFKNGVGVLRSYLQSNPTDSYAFWTGGGNDFAIASNNVGNVPSGAYVYLNNTNGNVGIGTTNPGATLELYKSATHGLLINGGTNVDSSTRIDFKNGNGANGAAMWSYQGDLRIDVGTFGSLTRAMTFLTSGNVGIGTTSPAGKLHVVGPDDAASVVAFMPGADTVAVGTPSLNVGIGTTGPLGPLHVSHSGSNLQALIVGDQTTIANNTGIYGRTSGIFDLNTPGGGTITFSPNGSELMRLTAGGNVGIGTTGPGQKLQIHGLAGNPATSGTTQNGIIAISNANTFTTLWGGAHTADPYGFWLQASARNDLSVNEPLILNPNGGNVGIGTAGPGEKLTVIGNIQTGSASEAVGTLRRVGIITGGVFSAGMETEHVLPLSGGQNSQMVHFNTHHSGVSVGHRMTIDIDGNVGIGTTSPGARFHVKQASDAFPAGGMILEDPVSGNQAGIIASGGNLHFRAAAGSTSGQLNSLGAFVDGSDRAYKKDIQDLARYGLETVVKIQPREYRMKSNNIVDIGFIAQEMQTVVPEVVSGEDGSMGISYGHLVPVLVNAIKELDSRTKGIGTSGQGNVVINQGNVGIGTATPAAALDVQTATPGLKIGATCVSGSCLSDATLKADIRYLSGSLDTVARLKPAAFRFKDDPNGLVGYGLIAQDVQSVAPQFVSKGGDGALRIDYSPLTMMLLEAVQELKAENDALKARLDALEKRKN